MPRASWRLVLGRPVIEVSIAAPGSTRGARRLLLADTGAGSAHSGMELILTETDRDRFSAGIEGRLRLGGAFTGSFQTFWLPVAIPRLGYSALCVAVAVPDAQMPRHVRGIACFRFLNRFTYGNFGAVDRFGLEVK